PGTGAVRGRGAGLGGVVRRPAAEAAGTQSEGPPARHHQEPQPPPGAASDSFQGRRHRDAGRLGVPLKRFPRASPAKSSSPARPGLGWPPGHGQPGDRAMKRGAFARLMWVKPKKKRKALPPELALLAASPVGRALREAVQDLGLPEPRDAEDRKTPQA